jgi:hypothetical protein
MRLFAISLVVGVVVVSSCSRKSDPNRVMEQRKERIRATCEDLAQEFHASSTWAESIRTRTQFPAFDASTYTIDVQNALMKTQRIVSVGTVHDILQKDGAYRVCLSYGYDSWDWSFQVLPVMFILTCSNEDADRLLGIPTRFPEPTLAFVAEVTAVEKAMFRVAGSDPGARDSFEVEVEPGRAFVAHGRCLAFKEVD